MANCSRARSSWLIRWSSSEAGRQNRPISARGRASPVRGEQALRAAEGFAGNRLGANYWKLLGANVLGNLGAGIAVIALPWYASTLTQDPLAIAAVGVAGRAPWLFLTLLAGVVGDRMDRRRLMVAAGGAKGLVLAGFALLVALKVGNVGTVLVLAAPCSSRGCAGCGATGCCAPWRSCWG